MKLTTILSLLIFLVLIPSFHLSAQLSGPESVFYDEGRDTWYISDTDGRSIYSSSDFVQYSGIFTSDLNSPRGLTMVNADLLTVCDGDRLQVFSIPAGLKVLTIPVQGSQMLNGIAVSNGSLYVSDFLDNEFYRIPIDGTYNPEKLQSSPVNGPNGLVAYNGRVYFVSWSGQIGYINPSNDNEIVILRELSEYDFLDGIAVDKDGYFYISAWEENKKFEGKIIRFNPDLMDDGVVIAENLSGPADMKYNASNHSLIVPEMLDGKVSEIELPEFIEAPILSSPSNFNSNVDTSTTLRWQSSNSGISSYDIQLASDSNFESLIIDVEGHTSVSLEINSLEFGTEYFWRVMANKDEVSSEWSAAWSFTTISQLEIPELISPIDNAINQSIKPELEWNIPTDQSAEFEVQLSLAPEFTELEDFITVLDQFTTDAFELDYQTSYYWRVRVIEGSNEGAFSSVYKFTTEGKLEQSETIQPNSDAKDIALSPQFTWDISDMNPVSEFSLTIDTSPLLDSENKIVINSIKDNSYTYDGELLSNTEYYWQVGAISHTGEQETKSSISHFTTIDMQSVQGSRPDDLLIYPNPVSDRINISTSNAYTIELFDINSELIYSIELNGNGSINMDNLAEGTYFLSFYSGKNKVFTEKIIRR